jgi:DNA-binding LacI/PurR family transcriptional regulator
VSNDVSAIGVINCLQHNGFKVPGDISVVGFDDIYLSNYIKPALTTFRNFTYKMGEVAADIMLRKLESKEEKSPQSIVVKGEVVLRDSVISRLKV